MYPLPSLVLSHHQEVAMDLHLQEDCFTFMLATGVMVRRYFVINVGCRPQILKTDFQAD